MDCVLSRFQSTELDLLCKWESFKNQQCLKYLFDPTYTKSFSASVMSMFTRLISSCSKKYSTAFLLMLKKMQSWSLAIHSKALSRSFRIVGKKTWVVMTLYTARWWQRPTLVWTKLFNSLQVFSWAPRCHQILEYCYILAWTQQTRSDVYFIDQSRVFRSDEVSSSRAALPLFSSLVCACCWIF